MRMGTGAECVCFCKETPGLKFCLILSSTAHSTWWVSTTSALITQKYVYAKKECRRKRRGKIIVEEMEGGTK